MSTFTVRRLPDRIHVPQDETEIWEAFEAAANAYVLARLPASKDAQHHQRFFISKYDMNLVRAEDRQELARTLGDREKADSYIPMRWALNTLRSYVESFDRIRKALRLPELTEKRDDMDFHYYLSGVIDKLRWQLRARNALIGELVAELRAKRAEPEEP